MTESTNKTYNLEDRTLEFAKAIMRFCKQLPREVITVEIIKQIIRSGTSIGANYREANEALGRKDFTHRMSIARKEAKETTYWLELLKESQAAFLPNIEALLQESKELRNIFTSIINKTK